MRSKGLGGTDIAALAGLNPWKGPMDVYLEKLGLVDSEPDNEAMYWGKALEPVLAKRYKKEKGIEIEIPDPQTLPFVKMPPEMTWITGSPDAVYSITRFEQTDFGAWMNCEGGVDFKTTGRRQDYGDPGTDQVPDWVACQCQWYCGLTGAKWWDVAVLFFAPRREFAIYHLERNQEIIDQLTEIGREFWEGHVIPQVPPPIDGSAGSKRFLDLTYPQDRGEMLAATGYIQSLVDFLKNTRDRLKEAEEEKLFLENRLKNIIQDAAGIQGDGWKVTWKKTRDRKEIDWEGIAEHIANMQNIPLDPYISGHTITKRGPRVFRLWVKEEK